MSTSTLPQAQGTSDLVRPHYSPGLMLQDDDLGKAVDFTRGLSQLLLKNLFGCGVVCGFEVKPEPDACNQMVIVIEEGVAIDGHGDPIHLKNRQGMVLTAHMPHEFWITIQRRETQCERRELACEADEDGGDAVFTRVREGYQIGLLTENPAPGACSCITKDSSEDKRRSSGNAECYKPHIKGNCRCACGDGDGGVVLAHVTMKVDKEKVTGLVIDHSVRRFIRPALLRDPLLGEPATAAAAAAG